MKKLILIMFLFFLPSISFGKDMVAEITFYVVDEENCPVADIPVGMQTLIKRKTGPNFGEDSYDKIEGITDKNGLITLQLSSKTGEFYYGIHSKKGFYDTDGKEFVFKNKKNGYWEPRNPKLTLVAQRIGKQVPMYARMVGVRKPFEIPEVGKPIGYDLIESDWVAPYGKGKISDIVFKMERKFVNNKDFDITLNVSFSNDGDGIQSVYSKTNYGMLTLPRQAPEEGYEKLLVKRSYRVPGGPYVDDDKEDQNYFFRVRTVKKDGKIVSAMYGKIHGNLEFWPNMRIRFTYFLNPDGTRNMEFDKDKNLLLNIPSSERPGGP